LFQIFAYTEDLALRTDEVCMDASSASSQIKLFGCHGLGGNQAWVYKVFIILGYSTVNLYSY